MSIPSLRQLADQLDLSHATVSQALRGSARVKPSTRLRIIQVAEQMGYRRNPLASNLMAEMRRSRGAVFRGTLAVLGTESPTGRPSGAGHYRAGVAAGAVQRAEEMGFKVDEVVVNRGGYDAHRLTEIFGARGISGVFVLPLSGLLAPGCIDWSRFSGIHAGDVGDEPCLNAVCPDYFGAMILALTHLRARGYRRPGLVMDAETDARVRRQWVAACHSFFIDDDESVHDRKPLRPLVVARLDEASFTQWFKAGDFDVVLAEDPRLMDWMRNAGAEIPYTHGFCGLNLAKSAPPCAGLDLRPQAVGRRGMELLVGQVLRNERGVLELPMTATIPALWTEGPTLRVPPGARPV